MVCTKLTTCGASPVDDAAHTDREGELGKEHHRADDSYVSAQASHLTVKNVVTTGVHFELEHRDTISVSINKLGMLKDHILSMTWTVLTVISVCLDLSQKKSFELRMLVCF